MISIVVPVYNGEKYLDDCIKSILLQTYMDWELLLIDNASSDDSLKLCKEYARKDDRIQVLHQYHNQGVSAARNLGIEKAAGEYLTFIDIDDWIDADYLMQLVTLAEEEKTELTICEYHRTSDKDREMLQKRLAHTREDFGKAEEGAKGDSSKRNYHVRKYEGREYLENYFLQGNTHCWGVLMERKLLDGQHFPKGLTIGEDMLFMLELAGKAESIGITDYKGYNYYNNEGGAMNRKFVPSYMDQITCWERAAEIISKTWPELMARVESIVVISIMLVVGKLSALDSGERKAYIEEEKSCYEKFMKYAMKKEVRKYLPGNYRLKIFIYRFFPRLYILLYGRIRGREKS